MEIEIEKGACRILQGTSSRVASQSCQIPLHRQPLFCASSARSGRISHSTVARQWRHRWPRPRATSRTAARTADRQVPERIAQGSLLPPNAGATNTAMSSFGAELANSSVRQANYCGNPPHQAVCFREFSCHVDDAVTPAGMSLRRTRLSHSREKSAMHKLGRIPVKKPPMPQHPCID